MSVGQRLKELRKLKKISQGEIAELLKCSQACVSGYERDEREMPYSTLAFIANCYNVNLNWLLTGTGDMFLDDFVPQSRDLTYVNYIKQGKQAHLDINSDDDNAFWHLEVAGHISAGEPLHDIREYEPLELLPISQRLLSNPNKYYCFVVNGDSMTPEIEHGDYVILSKRNTFDDDLDGKIVAVNSSDGFTLKKLVIDHQNRLSILFPLNKNHNYIILDDRHKIVGVMKMIIRMFKD